MTNKNRTAFAVACGLAAATTTAAVAQEAPLFQRPFDGVPVARDDAFTRIVPPTTQKRGAFNLDPANLPARFSESVTTPAQTGATAGFGYFGQFIDHDLDLSLESETDFLLPPFVHALEEEAEGFINLRTPGFDLDSVYGFGPLDGFSADEQWYDFDTGVGLRFRFGTGPTGAIDHLRDQQNGRALIGDMRNDENGLVGQVHRAFMQLHNDRVDHILQRDAIDEQTLTPGSQAWWDVFNEARNWTTAYYQGIVCNDFMPTLTGRSLFDALEDQTEPLGPLPEGPQIPLEFAQGAYRLHTIIPASIQIGSNEFVSPIDPVLRSTVPWGYLFGPRATPAGKVDTFVPADLRDIVSLTIPGVGSVNLDLGQINIMRGREVQICTGEEYLAFLIDELGLPTDVETIRGKTVLDFESATPYFNDPDDAPMMNDLQAGATDLWVYVMAEASINDGLLGPVGQDILERTFGNLLLDDPYSLVGANSDQFTQAQLDFFKSATLDGLIDLIWIPGDVNLDDQVDATDVGQLLGLWGTDELAADVNGDGVVDSRDLGQLIANWNE